MTDIFLSWRRQMQWRSLAGSVALAAILVAAPLSSRHALDVEATTPSPMPQIDRGGAARNSPGEIRVHSPSGSMPGPETVAPGGRPVKKSATEHRARATPIANAGATDASCRELLERARLGKPLSKEHQTLLRKECQ
jgi:hypothetical protein